MTVCTLPPKHIGPHRCDGSHTAGQCNDFPTSRYRERRPCPGCGHPGIRNIWPPMGTIGETVGHCTICKMEHRAYLHERAAAKLRLRVVALKLRRDVAATRRTR